MKKSWFTLWTQVLLCMGLACGVNTGNPGGKSPPPAPPSSATTDSVSLSLRDLAEGVVSFKATELIFMAKGAKLSDASNLVIPLPVALEISTGSVTPLLKTFALREGTYDRLVITVDTAAGVSLTDAAKNREVIGLAPFLYYPDSTIEDSSGVTRFLFDLSQNPLEIAASKAQAVILRSDLKTSFKPYTAIDPKTKAYFESKGLSSLRYTLFPETPARPVVTEIPAGQTESEAVLEFNLEAKFSSEDTDLETIEVCIYEGKLTQDRLAEDFCASEYYDYEVVEVERDNETSPGRFGSAFLLEPGEYTLAVFRDSPVYGLLHFETVQVDADRLKSLSNIALPREPLIEQQ